MNKLDKFAKILTLLKSLSADYLEKLITILTEELEDTNSIKGIVENERFADGRVCPICGCTHIVRNGHRGKTQRYLCKDCGKSFVSTTNTIVFGTKKNYKVWKKFIECMMEGMSVRDTSTVCDIHRNTAFVWRHKVLDALQEMQDGIQLSGIVEADETFFPISYKGNHKKSKTFTMPRDARHRGHSVKKSGISFELVCVPCAVDRKGHSVAKVGKLGKVSIDSIENTLGSHIANGSILCTDKEKAYRKFAKAHGLELIQLEVKQRKHGIYSIQHINSYHSQLKGFLYKFKGVSTKYLNNYLVWHNFVNWAKNTYKEKINVMLEYSVSRNIIVTYSNLANRKNLPLVA